MKRFRQRPAPQILLATCSGFRPPHSSGAPQPSGRLVAHYPASLFRFSSSRYLQATLAEISVSSALSVAPCVFLGLIVGAFMDRWSLQRTLVITSIGKAVALASVIVLLLCGALNFWSLAIIILMLGVLVLFAVDAVITTLSAVLESRIRVEEPKPAPARKDTTSGTISPRG